MTSVQRSVSGRANERAPGNASAIQRARSSASYVQCVRVASHVISRQLVVQVRQNGAISHASVCFCLGRLLCRLAAQRLHAPLATQEALDRGLSRWRPFGLAPVACVHL